MSCYGFPSMNHSKEHPLERFMWGWNHDNLYNKGKYLDKVIEIIEKGIKNICEGCHPFPLKDFESLDSWESGVEDHLFNQSWEEEYKDDQSFWNFLNDASRYLKRFKNNDPLYLLSDKEKKDGSKFLRRLKYPPSH